MTSAGGAPDGKLVGCTTVSMNYLAYAKVLAQSWCRVHPGSPFYVLLLDGSPTEHSSPHIRFLTPEDLGLPQDELAIQAAMYGPLEFATALKPLLLLHLLDQGVASAVFVDPDTEVYAPLDELGAAAESHATVLTPHVLSPVPLDGLAPSESDLAATGIFNLGLIAVGQEARCFLRWWGERLSRYCVIDVPAGLFVDQRWIDWAPSYFRHTVFRDPTVNVAFWNLHERNFDVTDAGDFTVDGNPLKHFHFSGFEPDEPELLSTYDLAYPRSPRVTIDSAPGLRQLCRQYAERVLAAGHVELSATPYGRGVDASGQSMSKWARAVYREAVLDAERRHRQVPPSPFDSDQVEAFHALTRDPWHDRGLSAEGAARLALVRARMDETPRRPPASRLDRIKRRARRVATTGARRLVKPSGPRAAALRRLLDDWERVIEGCPSAPARSSGIRPQDS